MSRFIETIDGSFVPLSEIVKVKPDGKKHCIIKTRSGKTYTVCDSGLRAYANYNFRHCLWNTGTARVFRRGGVNDDDKMTTEARKPDESNLFIGCALVKSGGILPAGSGKAS